MSGGSMDYLYSKVEEATFILNTPERKALHKHLQKLSKALRAVEWNDSGDGDDKERDLIYAVIGGNAILGSTIEEAQKVRDELIEQIQLAQAEDCICGRRR
jgi:hypothetical protein